MFTVTVLGGAEPIEQTTLNARAAYVASETTGQQPAVCLSAIRDLPAGGEVTIPRADTLPVCHPVTITRS